MKKLLAILMALGIMFSCLACGETTSEPAQDSQENAPTDSPEEVWPAPTDTITIIIPSSPGGGTDTKARIVYQYLAEELGCHVVVENITGGSHVVATESVLNNYAKDMTVLLHQMEPYFTSGPIRGGKYDIEQFAPIACIETEPMALFSKKGTGLDTFEDLVNAMQSKALSYSYLTGSFMAVGPEMTCNLVGGQPLIGVPYEGGSECATALLGGHVDFYCKGLNSTMAYYSEDFVPLVVFANERQASYPDVPTANELLSELGYGEAKDLQNLTYYLCTKEAAESYPDRYEVIQEAFARLFDNPGFIKALEDLSYVPYYLDSTDLKTAINDSASVVNEFSQYWAE